MKRLEDFQRLKGEFDTEVLRVYDSKLKGNYFIHQSEPNRDGRGIDYNTGGRELAQNGARLIVPAVNLFANDFIDLARRLQGEYYKVMHSDDAKREQLSEGIGKTNKLERGIRYLSDERGHLRPHSYLDVYPAISHFSEQTPKEYRQGLGEMIFHQLRLVNMCGLGERDPFQFYGLDRILQLIPEKDFLSIDQIRQVGEGLVREVLKSKDGCINSAEARQTIQSYGITSEDLLRTVEKMESLEAEYKTRMDRHKMALEEQKEKYLTFRRSILSSIGEDMHLWDYRE